MQQFLHPFCLAIAIAGFLLLLWPPRRLRSDTALAALAVTFGLSALSFVVSLASVWEWLDRTLPRPGTGILIAFGAVIALETCQLVVLANWTLSPAAAKARTRGVAAAGALIIACLALLFFLLPSHEPVLPQNFTATYLHNPVYQSYLLLYLAAYAAGEVLLAAGATRAARRTEQIWIARGLWVVATGSVLTIGYAILRFAAVISALSGSRLPSFTESATWICADFGSAFSLVGFFVPMLAVSSVPQLQALGRAHREYRRLAPLWNALHQAVPTIALQPAHGRVTDQLRVRGISWHLYRRCVEIRDGQWTLRHHLEASVRREADTRHRTAGLSGRDLTAAVTADQIQAALHAFHQGRAPRESTGYADTSGHTDALTPDDDLDDLLRIARRFATSGTATTTELTETEVGRTRR